MLLSHTSFLVPIERGFTAVQHLVSRTDALSSYITSYCLAISLFETFHSSGLHVLEVWIDHIG